MLCHVTLYFVLPRNPCDFSNRVKISRPGIESCGTLYSSVIVARPQGEMELRGTLFQIISYFKNFEESNHLKIRSKL